LARRRCRAFEHHITLSQCCQSSNAKIISGKWLSGKQINGLRSVIRFQLSEFQGPAWPKRLLDRVARIGLFIESQVDDALWELMYLGKAEPG
jgi:hypothetical protein